MKIVIIARKTGWVKEEPLERQDRYPMFAAAHCVSLVKNGNIQPQDITVISDIEKNKYLDFLKKIGVNVLINKPQPKLKQCIEIAKQNPNEIICALDSDMYLFGKIDFGLIIENLLGDKEMITGDGKSFDPVDKIIRSTKQWDAKDFFDLWGYTIEELIDWSVREKKRWCLGTLYALRAETFIQYEKQLERNSNDELLAFALSKIIKTEFVISDGPRSKDKKLIVKNCDSSRFFYLQNPCDSKSAPEDFYWSHYGSSFKVLNIGSHVDDFCNSVINEYRIRHY